MRNNDYLKQKTDLIRFLVRVIVVHTETVKLNLNADESYALTLKSRGSDIVANITARTYFGARHGLETLSQLIW